MTRQGMPTRPVVRNDAEKNRHLAHRERCGYDKQGKQKAMAIDCRDHRPGCGWHGRLVRVQPGEPSSEVHRDENDEGGVLLLLVRRAVEPVQLIEAVQVIDDCGSFAPRKQQVGEKRYRLEAWMDGGSPGSPGHARARSTRPSVGTNGRTTYFAPPV